MKVALLTLLFLGDAGHHKPAERFRQLAPAFADRGIELVYTESADSLNPATLAKYDGLILYANTTKITPEQESALLDFVEGRTTGCGEPVPDRRAPDALLAARATGR